LQLASKAARKSAPPTGPVVEKRKRPVEMCENCSGEYDSEDDGCCKYRSRARSETRKRSVKICDNCGEEENSEDDGCCKWRRMQRAR
jgi:hypothetical protein